MNDAITTDTADLPESIVKAREKRQQMLAGRQENTGPVLVETKTGAPPLVIREEDRLAELEQIIGLDIDSFVRVGRALREIRDGKLYRADYLTFEDYLEEKWDMRRRTGYGYVWSSQVVDNLCAIAHIERLPKNQEQVRPLIGLEPEEQATLWQKALDTAPEGKVTGLHVENTVKTEKGEKIKQRVAAAKERGENELIDPEFAFAFDHFLEAIEEAIKENWQTTDRRAVIKRVKSVLTALEGRRG